MINEQSIVEQSAEIKITIKDKIDDNKKYVNRRRSKSRKLKSGNKEV